MDVIFNQIHYNFSCKKHGKSDYGANHVNTMGR